MIRSAGSREDESEGGEVAEEGEVEEPTCGGPGQVSQEVTPACRALVSQCELEDFDDAPHGQGDEQDVDGQDTGWHAGTIDLFEGVDQQEGHDEVHAEVDDLIELGDFKEGGGGEVAGGHDTEDGDDHQPHQGLQKAQKKGEEPCHGSKIRKQRLQNIDDQAKAAREGVHRGGSRHARIVALPAGAGHAHGPRHPEIGDDRRHSDFPVETEFRHEGAVVDPVAPEAGQGVVLEVAPFGNELVAVDVAVDLVKVIGSQVVGAVSDQAGVEGEHQVGKGRVGEVPVPFARVGGEVKAQVGSVVGVGHVDGAIDEGVDPCFGVMGIDERGKVGIAEGGEGAGEEACGEGGFPARLPAIAVAGHAQEGP